MSLQTDIEFYQAVLDSCDYGNTYIRLEAIINLLKLQLEGIEKDWGDSFTNAMQNSVDTLTDHWELVEVIQRYKEAIN
jgi:hypothetical protein